jgi:hypothetical protein
MKMIHQAEWSRLVTGHQALMLMAKRGLQLRFFHLIHIYA